MRGQWPEGSERPGSQRAAGFVNSLGWLTLLLSVAVGLGAMGEAVTAHTVSDVPEFTPAPMRSSGGAGVLWRRAVVHAGLAAVGMVAARGLFRRRSWASNLTSGLIVLATAALVPELVGAGAAAHWPPGLTLLGFASVCVLHANVLRRLRHPEVRSQFDTPPGP